MSRGGCEQPVEPSSQACLQTGRVSNAHLMVGCLVFLAIALSGIGVLLEMSPNMHKGAGRVVMAAYWPIAGGLCGCVVWAIRLRVCRFRWSEQGFAFRIGWTKSVWYHFSWTDPIEYFLYSDPYKPPFVFVLKTPLHEVRIDSMQMPRPKIELFLRAIKKYQRLAERPYAVEMVDQGPSLRFRALVTED